MHVQNDPLRRNIKASRSLASQAISWANVNEVAFLSAERNSSQIQLQVAKMRFCLFVFLPGWRRRRWLKVGLAARTSLASVYLRGGFKLSKKKYIPRIPPDFAIRGTKLPCVTRAECVLAAHSENLYSRRTPPPSTATRARWCARIYLAFYYLTTASRGVILLCSLYAPAISPPAGDKAAHRRREGGVANFIYFM